MNGKKGQIHATLRPPGRRMLAEWEPQSCVQLTWPHAGTDWAPMLADITAVYEEMAHAISKREALMIVAPKSLTPDLSPLTPHLLPFTSNDTWARDHGFITVEESDGTKVLLDFQFNGWGQKFAAELDNQINRQLYEQELVEGRYESHLDFVLEGGSIESDGRGTIFTTRCCLMAPHRNQPLTQQQIDERLKQYLGAERVVWLEHGSLIGDDTDGHIDTLVRICPDDTIIYTGGDVPLPRPIYDDGDRLPATYANYLVVNGAVLVPTYNQPDLDQEAMRVVGLAYPDREIVGIDCRPVIRQHGSLHCCTMQYY